MVELELSRWKERIHYPVPKIKTVRQGGKYTKIGSALSSTISDSHTYVEEKLIDTNMKNGRDADIMQPQ